MIARSIKGKLLVFSVFFLGIASGALMTYAWGTRLDSSVITGDVKTDNRAKAVRDVTDFYNYLGLSEEQRSQVREITEASSPEVRKIYRQAGTQVDAIKKETRNQIRAILTEEQKKTYDEFNERNAAKRSKQKPQPQRNN